MINGTMLPGQLWSRADAFTGAESQINMAPKKRYYALAKAKEIDICFDYWGNVKHLTQGTSNRFIEVLKS